MSDERHFSALALRISGELEQWTEDVLDRDLDAASTHSRARAASRAASGRREVRRRRTRGFAATMGSAAILLCGSLFLHKFGALDVTVGSEKAPYALGDWASAAQEDLPLEFSDGSRMVLAPKTRARVVSTQSNGATVFIESGSANVSVVPRGDSDWALSLGPFAVHVTGTEFDVAWDPEQDEFELTLRRGSVTVSGCVFGDGRRISPNETVRASCGSRRYEVQQSDKEEEAAPPSAAPSSSEVVQPRTAGARSPAKPDAPGWQDLAESGKYGEAFERAQRGGFDRHLKRLSAAELTTLAGVARYAGRVDKAQLAYRAVRRRFSGGKQASAAAYALARIAFDQQGAYSEAAKWFGTYLAEAPSGSLAREALGRRMEAFQRAGAKSASVKTARVYLAKYPDGPHAALARSMVPSGG